MSLQMRMQVITADQPSTYICSQHPKKKDIVLTSCNNTNMAKLTPLDMECNCAHCMEIKNTLYELRSPTVGCSKFLGVHTVSVDLSMSGSNLRFTSNIRGLTSFLGSATDCTRNSVFLRSRFPSITRGLSNTPEKKSDTHTYIAWVVDSISLSFCVFTSKLTKVSTWNDQEGLGSAMLHAVEWLVIPPNGNKRFFDPSETRLHTRNVTNAGYALKIDFPELLSLCLHIYFRLNSAQLPICRTATFCVHRRTLGILALLTLALGAVATLCRGPRVFKFNCHTSHVPRCVSELARLQPTRFWTHSPWSSSSELSSSSVSSTSFTGFSLPFFSSALLLSVVVASWNLKLLNRDFDHADFGCFPFEEKRLSQQW